MTFLLNLIGNLAAGLGGMFVKCCVRYSVFLAAEKFLVADGSSLTRIPLKLEVYS